MKFTALSVAAAMLLAVATGCRDDAEPPREEEAENPAPERPPQKRERKPPPKRSAPEKQLRPRKKTSHPNVDAPSAPDKRSGGGKGEGKRQGQGGGDDGRSKEKGKDQGKGKSSGGGQGGNGGHGGQSQGGQGQGGGHGGQSQGGDQGGNGGHGGQSQGGGYGKSGGRLPKGWEDNRVSVPPAASEKQQWDMMVGELAKLTDGQAEFAPLGASGTSLKRAENKRFHAIGRCTITDSSGARSGYTFSCDFAGNGYEVVILNVEFSPAGD